MTFVQLTTSGSRVNAVIDTATLEGQAPNWTVSGQQFTASGVESGSALSLNMNGTAVTGNVTSGALILELPAQDGSLSPVHFASATAAEYDSAVAKLHSYASTANADYDASISYDGHALATECRAAGGSITLQSSNPYAPSSCTVAGVQDSVQDPGTGGAILSFPPSIVASDVRGCAAVGGRWRFIDFGGYYTGQTGWDCVVAGFQDQVVGFSRASDFDIPLSDAPAVARLSNACTNAEGDFGLDGSVFSCLVNGTTNDDLVLTPRPHFGTPLAVAGTSGALG